MFNGMKVGTRLAIAFGAVVVLLIAVVSVGTSRMALINSGLRTITAENNVEMLDAIKMRAAAFDISLTLRNMMLYTEDAKLKEENDNLQKAIQTFESASDALGQMFSSIQNTGAADKELLAKATAESNA